MIKLEWITPKAEELLGYMARVSNPDNQSNPSTDKLIGYLIKNNHWSPFEMVSACFEINTTRDIGRQILRHRSFSFQEFSQRYEDVSKLPRVALRECRLQDSKNRQNSIATNDDVLLQGWSEAQTEVFNVAINAYQDALANGIAKEQARALLPEGLTPSRMYMAGTLRSWIHYLQIRTEEGVQKEHRDIAFMIKDVLAEELPNVFKAIG